MTICIAALCENSKIVVVASDRMVTANFLALKFEHPNTKIGKLADCCVGLTAGDALAHTELFRACKQQVQQLKTPQVEIIVNEVKDQFLTLRQKRAEEEILRPRGFTFPQFYKDGLINRIPSELAVAIDQRIQNFTYPLSILIAGIDDTGAHIYGVEDPGVANCFDLLGYHAIGSGDRHALYSLIDNEHNDALSLKETVFLVYEAKKRAELAPGVGEAVEIAIITKRGVKSLTKDENSQLEEIHAQSIAPKQKKIVEAISQLKFEV